MLGRALELGERRDGVAAVVGVRRGRPRAAASCRDWTISGPSVIRPSSHRSGGEGAAAGLGAIVVTARGPRSEIATVTYVASSEQADDDASAAAARAGVAVRALHQHTELAAARHVWDTAWPSVAEGTQVTPNLLRAIEHSGGYLSGAYAGETIAGAAVALVGRHESAGGWQPHLHSHMAATVPGQADHGVGTALKLHQRAWALAHDIGTVVWTFDPLVRRNARLNLVKLGVTAAEYLPDFYGEMPDEVNTGDPSDRLLAHWDLASARVAAAVAGHGVAPSAADVLAAGAVRVLARSASDEPVRSAGDVGIGGSVLVALPEDIVRLRASAPEVATAWRFAVREVLQPLLVAGGVVTGLTVEGDYVVEA